MESLHSSVSLKELKEHRRQVSYPRKTIFYGELSKHDIGKGQCPADLTQCSRKSQITQGLHRQTRTRAGQTSKVLFLGGHLAGSPFLTSRRDVETVELSFVYHLALELPLGFLRQVTGKRLVWGGGRLNEGSNHCDLQLATSC